MAYLDPRVLQGRGERAWERKRPWYAVHTDVWALCAPGLSPYASGGAQPEIHGQIPAGSQGQPRHQLLYDSTLAGDIEDLANDIVHVMFPVGRDWSELVPGPLLGSGQGESAVKRALKATKDRMFAEIHASNFQLAANMMVFDGCVSGTGCMKVGRSADSSTLLDFEAVNQAHVAFEPGPRHSIWGFYRKMTETRQMIEVLWPEADLSALEREDRAPKGLMPRPYHLLECTTYDPVEALWHYDVLVQGSDTGLRRIYEDDYVVSPWVAWRYFLHPGEVQGRSRAMSAAPHARVANHAIRTRLRSASLRVNGMWTFTGDDVFNPDTAWFNTGGFIQVGSNDPRNPTIAPLPLPGDPQMGEIILADERQVIHERTLQADLPDEQGPVRSPTEIIARQRKHQRKQGQPFQRLIEEVGRPVLRAVAYLMSTKDQLPELDAIRPPAEGQVSAPPLMMNGKDVKVTFQSPMSMAQRLSDAETMVRVGEMAPVVGGGPENVRAALKGEDAVADFAEKMGYPPELIRDEDEREERAAQERDAMLAQAQGAQGAQAPEQPQPQLPIQGV